MGGEKKNYTNMNKITNLLSSEEEKWFLVFEKKRKDL
jgi:hypothetical protein